MTSLLRQKLGGSSSNLSADTLLVAQSYMLPMESQIVRRPGEQNKSALAKPDFSIDFSFHNDYCAYDGVQGEENGAAVVMLTDDPLHAVMVRVPYNTGAYRRQVYFANNLGNYGSFHLENAVTNQGRAEFPNIYAEYGASGNDSGRHTYAWKHEGRSCLLLCNTLNVGHFLFENAVLSGGVPILLPSGLQFTLYWSDGGEWIPGETVSGGTTPASVTLQLPSCALTKQRPIFVTFSAAHQVNPPTGPDVDITVNYFAAGDIFQQYALPGLWPIDNSIDWVRPHGVAMLLNQVGATMYLGGRVWGRQQEIGHEWTGLNHEALSKQLECPAHDLTKGVYTYIKPPTHDRKATPFSNDPAQSATNGHLSDPTAISVMAVGVLFAKTTAPVATDITVRVCFQLEFGTSSQLFDIEHCKCDIVDYLRGQQLVNQCENYHENPLHWADIKRALVWGVKTYGPSLGRALLAAL